MTTNACPKCLGSGRYRYRWSELTTRLRDCDMCGRTGYREIGGEG